jgi:hypothetical protein
MSWRANFGTCLFAGLSAAALLCAAGAADAQSPATSPSVAHASAATDDCVRYVEGQAMVVRCAVAAPRVLADHGMSVGEPYDVQGNPVDHHGDIVAVPGQRGQTTREVFTRDRQTLR